MVFPNKCPELGTFMCSLKPIPLVHRTTFWSRLNSLVLTLSKVKNKYQGDLLGMVNPLKCDGLIITRQCNCDIMCLCNNLVLHTSSNIVCITCNAQRAHSTFL